MESIDRKRAFNAPESEFRVPLAVVLTHGLSYDDKIAVLRNWKQGLVQLQKANEESMRNGHGTNDVATRLTAVTAAMSSLREARRV